MEDPDDATSLELQASFARSVGRSDTLFLAREQSRLLWDLYRRSHNIGVAYYLSMELIISGRRRCAVWVLRQAMMGSEAQLVIMGNLAVALLLTGNRQDGETLIAALRTIQPAGRAAGAEEGIRVTVEAQRQWLPRLSR